MPALRVCFGAEEFEDLSQPRKLRVKVRNVRIVVR